MSHGMTLLAPTFPPNLLFLNPGDVPVTYTTLVYKVVYVEAEIYLKNAPKARQTHHDATICHRLFVSDESAIRCVADTSAGGHAQRESCRRQVGARTHGGS